MAGFFGFFDYTKEGKGVSKDEPEKKPFFHFLDLLGRKFWKLVQLNFLYLIFCIPIVTIGPATAALTFICREMANERPIFMASDFWDAFKANFKQSLIYSLLSAIVTFVAVNAILFYVGTLSAGLYVYVLLGVVLLAGFILMNMNFYVYLMIVTVNLKLTAILKNAFIFTFLGFKSNIFTFLVVGGLTFLSIWYFPISLLPMAVIYFSFCTFVTAFNSYPYLRRYIIDPYYATQGDSTGTPADEPIFSDKLIETDKQG